MAETLPNPLVVSGNWSEKLALITNQYQTVKAAAEDKRDEWQDAIYDAVAAGASLGLVASWVGVSTARVGAIVSRVTAIRQQQALRAA